MKRLVGYDLNGWSDFAARNWIEIPGQEALEGQEQVTHGALGGVVVTVAEGANGQAFIGGAQALRSPHGRGGGWGDVGKKEYRDHLLGLLERSDDNRKKLAAAMLGLADCQKATTVLSIPDIPEFGEDQQEAFLACLQSLRARQKLLVWRPVLAVLAALEDIPDATWESIQDIGVIIHTSKGFSSQRLQLRKETLFAPERRSGGRHFDCDLGLEFILAQASAELKSCCSDHLRIDHLEASQLPWRLALGHKCEAEPLRHWNGSWEVVAPPEKFVPDVGSIPDALVDHIKGCNMILFHTPAVGAVRELIASKLDKGFGRAVDCLDPQAIARGALAAARRISEGHPIYYDFLPQISTIVQDSEGAKSFELIPAGTLLPAGQSYQSSRPARFGLVAGMEEIKVHLKRETDVKPRRSVVKLDAPPATHKEVELHLQQTPAAGRARLTLMSDAFSGPMIVDWHAAKELDKSWEEIIESLEPEKPTVPNRLILPCGTDTWHEMDGRLGLRDLLQQELAFGKPNWKLLASKLSSRSFGRYPISSDGEFPDELEQVSRGLLEDTIGIAEIDVRDRISGKGTRDNQSLRFLTWLFHKCPDWIVPHLLDGVAATTGDHVFVKSGGSRALMLQGIGRTAKDPEHQKRAFQYLLKLPLGRWKKDQMACAAFLLSRTDSAPKLLDRKDVEFLAKVAETKVLEAVGKDFTSAYIYGPFLLVGLLRWRLRDPWALVAEKDPVADALLSATRKLKEHLDVRRRKDNRLERYQKVLEQVCEELEGKGSNPDILVDLESLVTG